VEGSCEHGNEAPGSRRCLENSSVTERMVASQGGLSSMELVSWLVSDMRRVYEKVL
jgi:hypothetical protein